MHFIEVNLYATRFNAHLAASCLPICVCNSTDKDVLKMFFFQRSGGVAILKGRK